VGITFVFVTHDQQEALTMSDRIAVFNAGRIEQVGTPAEVYDQPGSTFVASFVGTANILRDDVARAVLGEDGCFAIRPEKIALGGEAGPGDVTATGRIVDAVYAGPTTRFVVRLDSGGADARTELVALQQNLDISSTDLQSYRDTTVTLRWRRDHAIRLPT
jgi:putative spermidine/putrescine transport system ATP-binding protein